MPPTQASAGAQTWSVVCSRGLLKVCTSSRRGSLLGEANEPSDDRNITIARIELSTPNLPTIGNQQLTMESVADASHFHGFETRVSRLAGRQFERCKR